MKSEWKDLTLGDVAQNISRRFDFNDRPEVVFINTGDVLGGNFLVNTYTESGGLPGQAKKAIESKATTHSEALSLRIPPPLNLAQVLRYVDSTELVEDDDLLRAGKSMLLQGHQLAEPGSCAGLAALWRSRESLKGKTVVLVVSGANLDEPTMRMVMDSTLLF
jgi:threonine synthase